MTSAVRLRWTSPAQFGQFSNALNLFAPKFLRLPVEARGREKLSCSRLPRHQAGTIFQPGKIERGSDGPGALWFACEDSWKRPCSPSLAHSSHGLEWNWWISLQALLPPPRDGSLAWSCLSNYNKILLWKCSAFPGFLAPLRCLQWQERTRGDTQHPCFFLSG